MTIIYIITTGVIGIALGMVIELMAEMPYIRRLEEELEMKSKPVEIIELEDEYIDNPKSEIKITKQSYFDPF